MPPLSHHRTAERGAFIALTVVFVFVVLLALLVLVGFGMVVTAKIKQQDVTNLTALAAISGYMDIASPTPSARLAGALDRANLIAQANQNQLIGRYNPSNEFAGLTAADGENGKVTLGRWVEPCAVNGQASCFYELNSSGLTAPISGGLSGVDAARVEIKVSAENPLIVPFAKVLGYDGINFSSQAYAAARSRCITFVIDRSPSIAFNFPSNANPGKPFVFPFGMFVDDICSQSAENSDIANYCSLPAERTANATSPYNEEHFRDDYAQQNGEYPYGPEGSNTYQVSQYVNPEVNYFGPEPWYTVMSSFNSTLRTVEQRTVATDRVGVIFFDRLIRDEIPLIEVRSAANPAQFPLLIQLSNPNNRGTFTRVSDGAGGLLPDPEPVSPEIHPNFLDRGWTPLPGSWYTSTNLNLAIRATIDQLTSAACPAEAQRIAVLATDGLATCTNSSGGVFNPRAAPLCGAVGNDDWQNPDGLNEYARFIQSLNEFVPLLKESRQAEISWVVLHTGGTNLALHQINQKVDNKFVSWDTAGQSGSNFQGMFPGMEDTNMANFDHINAFGDIENPIFVANEDGWTAWRDNAAFNGANGYLFELAKGGLYCPIIRPLVTPPENPAVDGCGVSSDYELVNDGGPVCRLRDSVRLDNEVETRPIYLLSTAAQAARCVLKFVNDIPFVLKANPSLVVPPP